MEHLEVGKSDDNSLNYMIYEEVYLMIRRKKVTLYLDTSENIDVLQLKKLIEAKLNVRAMDQQLFVVFANKCYLDEYKELSDCTALLRDCGLSSRTAPLIEPAILGLAVRQKDGSFEDLEITPYSESDWPNLTELADHEGDCTKGECAAFRKRFDKMMMELEVAKSNMMSQYRNNSR